MILPPGPAGSATAIELAQVFERCFRESHNVCCLGGATEPWYLPARDDQPAQLHYRADFAASALHEISHWCIAGPARRARPDFGYDYVPAPRTAVAQVQFLQAEVLPQALECLFAAAAGLPFRLSFDDVEDQFPALRPGFAHAVATSCRQLQRGDGPSAGLGHRAQQFLHALRAWR